MFSLSLSARFFRGDSRGCSWRAASGTRVDSMAAAREKSRRESAARFFIFPSNLAPEHSAANHNARRARGRPPPDAYWLQCRSDPASHCSGEGGICEHIYNRAAGQRHSRCLQLLLLSPENSGHQLETHGLKQQYEEQ